MLKTADTRFTAKSLMASIETEYGEWDEYSNDGRLATSPRDTTWAGPAGTGYRARFADNPHGEDYGWGPLGQTEAEAIAFLLANELEDIQAELKFAQAELEALA